MANPDKDQQADEVEEQSSEETQDQADDEGTGVEKGDEDDEEDGGDDDDDEESKEESDDESEDGDEDDELIDDKKFEALKGDPDKLRKELQKAATKKFQKVAATRKALEPYADFISEYEKDPAAAVAALAAEHGIEIKVPKGGNRTAEEVVESITERVSKKVRTALGDDYADLSDKMSAAIQGAVAEMLSEELKPLREGQDALIQGSALSAAKDAIKIFQKDHPDWRDHEKEMVALSKKLPPSEGVSEVEYLGMIYTLATRDKKRGDKISKTIKKMANNVKGSEGKTRAVSDNNVSKGSGKLPSFREAAAAAERGERFE